VTTIKEQKLHGIFLLEVSTPCDVKMLVEESLLHDRELKDCRLFHDDYNLTQCFAASIMGTEPSNVKVS
jgi:hypothetical protein